jgi:S1-C subfamily serine protease
VFAEGGRGAGIAAGQAAVVSGMDTEHTGVEGAALDAYSRVVTGVAAGLLPSVAALSVRTSRGAGAGSAVTFTDDGFLLTNAHVIAGASGGTAAFADGTETTFDVVGTVQALQRLMLGPAIGRNLPITVLRRNAFVDVVAVPAELS